MGLLKKFKIGSTPKPSTSSTRGKKNRRKSFFFFISPSDVTEESLEVWRHLPSKIRHDPSMVSFQLQQEKLHGNIDENDPNAIKSNEEDDDDDDDDDDDEDSIDQSEFITINVTDEHGNGSSKLPSSASPSNTEDIVSADDKPSPSVSKTPSAPSRTTSHDKVVSITDPKTNQIHTPALDHFDIHDAQKSKTYKYTKMVLLVIAWLIFTAILTQKQEKKLGLKHLVVGEGGQPKSFYLQNMPRDNLVRVSMRGAFSMKPYTNTTPRYLAVFLQHHETNIDIKQETTLSLPNLISDIWRVPILDDVDLANSTLTTLRYEFEIPDDKVNMFSNSSRVRIRMYTNLNEEFVVGLIADTSPVDKNIGVYYAIALLVLLYSLIIFELVHRTFAAVMVSTMSIAVLAFMNDRPTFPHEIVDFINVETLLLLFSMMILVAMLTETGVFDYIAVWTYKVTNGKIWPLIHSLCIITVIVSAFLDNVTTVLLMTPITIRLCEVMELNPTPVLMGIIVHANIGGALTPIGDASNIIISSDHYIVKHGITFTNFTLHMTIGIILVIIQTCIQLRIHFRNINDLRFKEPKVIKNLRREIVVWERAAASISPFSKNGELVRQTLRKKVKILKHQLKKQLACSVTVEKFEMTLEELQEQYPIKNKNLLIQSGYVLGLIIVMFFIESFPQWQTLSLGWSALLGVMLLLIISKRDDMDALMHRVEWTTLLFFAAMFIIMECTTRLGLTHWIGYLTENLVMRVEGEDMRLAVAIILILWVSAISSAFMDSVIVTTMMIKIVVSLADNSALNLPLQPLVWALAFGQCIGGNGTLYGASSNVVCAGIVEQHGYRFSFNDYFKIGFPIMIGSVIVTTGYLMVAHVLVKWQ